MCRCDTKGYGLVVGLVVLYGLNIKSLFQIKHFYKCLYYKLITEFLCILFYPVITHVNCVPGLATRSTDEVLSLILVQQKSRWLFFKFFMDLVLNK